MSSSVADIANTSTMKDVESEKAHLFYLASCRRDPIYSTFAQMLVRPVAISLGASPLPISFSLGGRLFDTQILSTACAITPTSSRDDEESLHGEESARSTVTAEAWEPERSLQPAWQRLNEFAALQRNWDSYDADPISPLAIAAARRFLANVAEHLGAWAGERIAPCNIAPLVDGGILVEWRGPGGELEVEIGADGSLSYLHSRQHGSDRIFDEGDEVSLPLLLDVLAKTLVRLP